VTSPKQKGFKPGGVRWNQNSMAGEEGSDFELEQNRQQESGLAGISGGVIANPLSILGKIKRSF